MPTQDSKPLPPHKPGDRPSSKRFNDFEAKAITEVTVGPGLSIVRRGNAVTIANTRTGGRGGTSEVLVKITGNASGGGKYTGTLWTPPTVNIPATGNLTEAELGIAGDTIRIVNSAEVGLSTHDLASSGYLPLIFPAVFLKNDDDDVPVYMIVGMQVKNCTPI